VLDQYEIVIRLKGQNPSSGEKRAPVPLCSPTNPRWRVQGLNPGLRGEKLVSKRLNFDTFIGPIICLEVELSVQKI
jgi:hypothetical protein